MCYPLPGPRCDIHTLDKALEKCGIQKGRSGEEVANRLELILTRGGLVALAEKIKNSRNSSYRNELLAAYKSGYAGWRKRLQNIEVEPRQIPNAPSDEELSKVRYLADVDRMSDIAYSLYSRPGAPLYDKARKVEAKQNETVTGYTPGTPHTAVLDTSDLARSMNVDASKLPEGYVAIDLETDTTNGYGLRPQRAQITEMVICTKEKTIILSGDEKHILSGFAKYMNDQESSVTLCGWNNSGFDNLFLDVRSRHHSIEGWSGKLEESEQQTGYASVGGFNKNQKLIWTGGNGIVHSDLDVMIATTSSPGFSGRSARLKPTARSHGMNPVELDRERLHEYSKEEREAYVASDGIATLFNLTHIPGDPVKS